MRTLKALSAAVLFAIVVSQSASGQTWDTSGNNLLQGTYYFREVFWLVGDNAGDLGRALAIYGNISFDGNGKYTLSNTQVLDSNVGSPQSYSTTGTYSIAASGYGFISSPISTGDSIYGLVSRGIFIGSSTESSFNDLFIAAPLASPAPMNATFQGAYSMVDIDFPTGGPADTRDSQFQLNPDGNGGIGTVQISGYVAGLGATALTQSIAGVRYFFSNGGANVNFGGTLKNNNFIAGTKYLYLSADGDFVFGGSPTGFDMIVGVRSRGTAPTYGGLYYQAGVNQDESQLVNGFADLETYYGCLKANARTILAHQRILSVARNNPVDYTYSDSYTLKPDGTYDDANYHYMFGAGGAIRIGLGKNPAIGINVALQAPALTPTGVFIDPTGIVNAASSALFTSGVAPGELITIYGTNMASATLADSTFPFSLGGVQMTINNRPAPIYSVSPNQISAVVPFGTTELIASIQLTSNGIPSNIVTSYVNLTAPGVFTSPAGGIGRAAALHPDFTVVTPANPARPGETIALFVTGLGAVNPAISDGAPGPSSTLSAATNAIGVTINGQTATVAFAGIAPQLVGLYQVNVQVPSGITSGDAFLDISGPDSLTSQALLPVGSGSGTGIGVTAAPAPRSFPNQRKRP
jgi:uncharacterized protein (TIGR03437 family)